MLLLLLLVVVVLLLLLLVLLLLVRLMLERLRMLRTPGHGHQRTVRSGTCFSWLW